MPKGTQNTYQTDINFDGRADFVGLSYADIHRPKLSYAIATDNGYRLHETDAIVPRCDGRSQVVMGDFNGDGLLDAVTRVRVRDGEVIRHAEIDNRMEFCTPQQDPRLDDCVEVGEFEEGWTEIVRPEFQTQIMYGRNNMTFSEPQDVAAPNNFSSFNHEYRLQLANDINGDGQDELIMINEDGYLVAVSWDVDQWNAFPITDEPVYAGFYQWVKSNGDGYPDLAYFPKRSLSLGLGKYDEISSSMVLAQNTGTFHFLKKELGIKSRPDIGGPNGALQDNRFSRSLEGLINYSIHGQNFAGITYDRVKMMWADVEGDGSQDLLLPPRHVLGFVLNDAVAVPTLLSSEEFERADAFNLLPYPLALQRAMVEGRSLSMDVNGDSFQDMLVWGEGGLSPDQANLYISEETQPSGSLTKIVDGLGRELNLGYKSLAHADYEWPRLTPDYPYLPMARGIVVDSVEQKESGRGGASRVFDYAYGPGKFDAVARESLGFAHWKRVDHSNNRVLYRELGLREVFEPSLRTYPLRNVVTYSISGNDRGVSGATRELKRSAYSYELLENGGYLRRLDDVFSQQQQFGKGWKTVTENTTTYQRDELGYVQHQESTDRGMDDVSQTVITETAYYAPDPVAWLMGLPQEVINTATSGGETYTSIEQYDFTSEGELAVRRVIDPLNLKPLFHEHYQRNPAGQVVAYRKKDAKQVEPDRVSLTRYDHQQLFPVCIVNPEGHHQYFAWNSLGLNTMIWTDQGVVLDEKNYDGFGRLRLSQSEGGDLALIDFLSNDEYPLIVHQQVGAGNVNQASRAYYNGMGQQVKSSVWHEHSGWLDTTFEYDELGQQTAIQAWRDGLLHQTRIKYDVSGRVIRTTLADNSEFVNDYGFLRVSSVNPLGQVSIVNFNGLGQVTSVIDDANNFGVETRYRYGPHGMRTALIDDAGNTTTMEYDQFGRRTAVIDPTAGEWRYEFNSFGMVVSAHAPDRQSASFQYDRLGRLVERRYLEQRGLLGDEVLGVDRWEWDSAPIVDEANNILPGLRATGLLHRVSNSIDGVVQEYRYQPDLKLNNEVYHWNGQRYVTEFDYAGDRIAGVSYPSLPGQETPGLRVNYSYLASGQPSKVSSLAPRLDRESGRMLLNEKTLWLATGWDNHGRLQHTVYGDGSKRHVNYELWKNRIAEIMVTNSASKEPALQPINVFHYGYEYDAIGNVLGRVEHVSGINETYSYDSLNRLTRVSTLGADVGDVAFTYDRLGNIVENSRVGVYDYGGDGLSGYQLSQLESPFGDREFQYDLRGRVTDDGRRQYQYGVNGKASQVMWGQDAVTYRYTPTGSLLEKRVNDVPTIYLGKLMEVTKQERTYRVVVGGQVVSTVRDLLDKDNSWNMTYTFNHHEALGSVAAVTGDEFQRMAYHPFGQRRDFMAGHRLLEEPKEQRGFTGHRHETALGLIDMNARLYDPELGRFMSADTVVPDPFNSQALNRYAYVYNNPLAYTDPTGHSPRKQSKGDGEIEEITVWGKALKLPSYMTGEMSGMSMEEYHAYMAEQMWGWDKDTALGLIKQGFKLCGNALCRPDEALRAKATGEGRLQVFGVDDDVNPRGNYRELGTFEGFHPGLVVEAAAHNSAEAAANGYWIEAAASLVEGVTELVSLGLEAGSSHVGLGMAAHVGRRTLKEAAEGVAETALKRAAKSLLDDTGEFAAAAVRITRGQLDEGVRLANGAVIKKVSPVVQVPGKDGDRLIAVFEVNGRRQAFYRSTGNNSGRPGDWLPFFGISEIVMGGKGYFFKPSNVNDDWTTRLGPFSEEVVGAITSGMSGALHDVTIGSSKHVNNFIEQFGGTAVERRHTINW